MVVVEKRLIAVAGATGLQGGSVVHYLLQDGTFRVRGLTRKPSSAKAQELQAQGVEIVFADFEDPPSLVAALQGAYGVFGVTNFWESMDGAKELQQGKALVDAAKANNIQHFVWSTVSAPPQGLDVQHWTSKVQVNTHLLASGVPRTSLYTTFYFENFTFFDFCKLSKVTSSTSGSGSSGPTRYVANWPLLYTDGPIGGYSVTETGAYALEAFKNPKKWIDADIYVPPDVFTPRAFVDALNEILVGKAEVKLNEVDASAFEQARTLGPWVEEIWTNMAAFYKADGKMRDMGGPTSSDSPAARAEESEKAILPGRLTMHDWIRKNVQELLATAL